MYEQKTGRIEKFVEKPPEFVSNKINNRKYNFITFLPLVFFYQFKHFLNLFFLVVALSQFYEPVRVGLLTPKIMPVCIILAVSFFKELWDEIQRIKKDKAVNSELYMYGNQETDATRIRRGEERRNHTWKHPAAQKTAACSGGLYPLAYQQQFRHSLRANRST